MGVWGGVGGRGGRVHKYDGGAWIGVQCVNKDVMRKHQETQSLNISQGAASQMCSHETGIGP